MPTKLGRYTVDKKLADGGMGSVFLGRSPHGVPVVLKVPHQQDKDSAMALADEARAGLRLAHPAIVETLDFFTDGPTAVLVVAYIEGSTLFELRRTAGPFTAAAVAQLGAELAGALDAIHTATDENERPLAMVHRDISPANVLLDTAGQPRLIDLGIVRSSERRQKATMQGMVKGTLRYLAPEILSGGEHTAATDLWALGVTLYETAIGRFAVAPDEIVTVRAAIDGSLRKEIERGGLDGALAEVLTALVAPVDARIRNARAAAAVLRRLADRLETGPADLARAAQTRPVAAPTSSPLPVPLAVPEPTEMYEREALPVPVPVPSTLVVARDDIDTRPTIQMPAIAGPIPEAATAPTLLMPAVDVPAPRPSSPPSVPKPAVGGPTASLFLPIVVIDEDGEEIG